MPLDLYHPHIPQPTHPLILFIHGGGWQAGDARTHAAFSDFPAELQRWANLGYVVASVNYRLSTEAPYPAAVEDIQAALAWLHANAQRLAIDPQRTGLWGASAGAHLAALTAVHTPVQAVVAWYGAFDLQTLNDLPPATADAARRWLGDIKHAANASPIHLLNADSPPMLLIHGDQDQVIPHRQSQAMARQLSDDTQLLILPGVGHSFTSPDAAQKQAAIAQAVHASQAFFQRWLQPTA